MSSTAETGEYIVHVDAIIVESSPEPEEATIPSTPQHRSAANAATPQWRSGKNTWRKLKDIVARRTLSAASTPTKALHLSNASPSRRQPLRDDCDFSQSPQRQITDTEVTPIFKLSHLLDISGGKDEFFVPGVSSIAQPRFGNVSNDTGSVRRHLGTLNRSPSPDSRLSASETLLEFDVDDLSDADFTTAAWGDEGFDGEGLVITEDAVSDQIAVEADSSLEYFQLNTQEQARYQVDTESNSSLLQGPEEEIKQRQEQEQYHDAAISFSFFTLNNDAEEPPVDTIMAEPSPAPNNSSEQIFDFLVLGAGWEFQFLAPMLADRRLTFKATTTSGRGGSIPFVFNSHLSDGDDPGDEKEAFLRLPKAKTVLITFPVKGKEAMGRFVRRYKETHSDETETQWILLGSTGVYSAPSTAGGPRGFQWFDNTSPCNTYNERWEAEEALLHEFNGCVLNLAGLYGEPERDGKIWERAVPKSKEKLREKKNVHFIHGADVARVILRVDEKGIASQQSGNSDSGGSRWLVSDGRVYDWWELVWDNSEQLEKTLEKDETERRGKQGLRYREWVLELMKEEGVRALPRPLEMFERGLDSRAVWTSLGITPMEKKFAWPS